MHLHNFYSLNFKLLKFTFQYYAFTDTVCFHRLSNGSSSWSDGHKFSSIKLSHTDVQSVVGTELQWFINWQLTFNPTQVWATGTYAH